MGFNKEELALIRAIQNENLYLERDPFQRIADSLGWPLGEVLDTIRSLREKGVIRRFGAAITPDRAGFKANAMVVWDLNGKDEEQTGKIMASHARVSHCYIRPSFNDFPYTLYTMIHADSEDELKEIISGLSGRTGVTGYRILKTLKELKKTSPVYFGPCR